MHPKKIFKYQWGKIACGYLTLALILILARVDYGETQTIRNPKKRFSEAQATFEEAIASQGEQKRTLMLKSAGMFAAILTENHMENGYVYYNIGNAYYEAGEIGKAILNYRKAQRLIPGHADLKSNLELVRKQIDAPVREEKWWTNIVKSLLFWHYLLDYSVRRLLFLGSFVLFWFVLAGMIFKRHIFLRTGLAFLILINLGFGGSFLVSSFDLYYVQSGVIVAKSTMVRKGPGEGYNPYFDRPLPGGTEFRLVEKSGGWWKVKLNSGEEVWLKSNQVELI